MKKILSMLCVVLVVGFAGTAFAGKMEKVEVCHNGSEYIGGLEINDVAEIDETDWVPAAFIIKISEKAETKHVDNHGDFVEGEFTAEGDPVITEVHVSEGLVTGFEWQQPCIPIILEP
jgi:hypothetical protein